MHRAALALGIAAAPAGEFGHHAFRIHAAGQHVTVIPVAGDHLVAVALGHLHADDDGFLADIEVAKAADQAHAVHLAGLLLEAPDQQHLLERVEFLFLAEFRAGLGGTTSTAGERASMSGSAFLVWATAISVLEISRSSNP